MTKQEIQILLKEETKYSRWYLDIIFKAKAENRKKLKKYNPNYVYYENHHILPGSIFPEYRNFKINSWNGVLLTAKEHYIVHALIWKHYKKLDMKSEKIKMGYAINRFNAGNSTKTHFKSKLYKYLRENIKRLCTQFEIYDEKGILQYENSIDENLTDFLKRNNLPNILGKSAKNNGEPIYITDVRIPAGFEDFRYWYALKKGTTRNKIYNEDYIKQVQDEYNNRPKREMSEETKKNMTAKRIKLYSVINNNTPKIVNFYDNNGNLRGTSIGNFARFCKENNYPLNAFRESYLDKGRPIYINSGANINRIKQKGYDKFQGWYALIDNEEQKEEYKNIEQYKLSTLKYKPSFNVSNLRIFLLTDSIGNQQLIFGIKDFIIKHNTTRDVFRYWLEKGVMMKTSDKDTNFYNNPFKIKFEGWKIKEMSRVKLP